MLEICNILGDEVLVFIVFKSRLLTLVLLVGPGPGAAFQPVLVGFLSRLCPDSLSCGCSRTSLVLIVFLTLFVTDVLGESTFFIIWIKDFI